MSTKYATKNEIIDWPVDETWKNLFFCRKNEELKDLVGRTVCGGGERVRDE